MNSPAFPLVYVLGEDLINFITEPETMLRIRASDFISKDMEQNGIVYDNAGNKWTFTTSARTFKNSGFSRFLAKTIYNPMVDIDIQWKHEGNYELKEVKDIVVQFVKNDTGIMKQLMGADFLVNTIDIYTELSGIVNLLKNYQFGLSNAQYAQELANNKQLNNRSKI